MIHLQWSEHRFGRTHVSIEKEKRKGLSLTRFISLPVTILKRETVHEYLCSMHVSESLFEPPRLDLSAKISRSGCLTLYMSGDVRGSVPPWDGVVGAPGVVDRQERCGTPRKRPTKLRRTRRGTGRPVEDSGRACCFFLPRAVYVTFGCLEAVAVVVLWISNDSLDI